MRTCTPPDFKEDFEKSHNEVVVAHNGKEALQYLEFDSVFNLILSEIMMPVMDGVEFLEHFKESCRTREFLPLALLPERCSASEKK